MSAALELLHGLVSHKGKFRDRWHSMTSKLGIIFQFWISWRMLDYFVWCSM